MRKSLRDFDRGQIRATVAQIAGKVGAGSDRKVSDDTVLMGLNGHGPVRVPECQKRPQWAREHHNWTTEQWKKVGWSHKSRFLSHHVDFPMSYENTLF